RAAVIAAQQSRRILDAAAARLKEKPENLTERLDTMVARHKALEKELEKLKTQIAFRSADGGGAESETLNGTAVIIKEVTVDSPAALRELADRFKDKLQSGVVVLGSKSGAKAFLIAGVTRDLTPRFHAGNIIKTIAQVVGGGGGGRPDMAQAGGSQPENLTAALEKARELIASGK
ncbi:MAG: DHHA1 domain-containing protein, partial [Desulfobacterales bacterium]